MGKMNKCLREEKDERENSKEREEEEGKMLVLICVYSAVAGGNIRLGTYIVVKYNTVQLCAVQSSAPFGDINPSTH